MTTDTTIESVLVEFITDELLDDAESVALHDNLLADDMVDSLGMVRLVAHIEATYSVVVPPEDFTIDHFRTVSIIAAYLRRLGAIESAIDGA